MSILYNGVQTTITSSSNTFSIDGLDIRATNTFNTGSATAEGGVSFTASADTEKVTETVKKFIEAYNAMIDEVRTQATTKPDSNYKPLTDDQKNEMNETSIKNWEDKAKEGILYNSSALKDLDNATQGIFSSMMINGVSYDDLERSEFPSQMITQQVERSYLMKKSLKLPWTVIRKRYQTCSQARMVL